MTTNRVENTLDVEVFMSVVAANRGQSPSRKMLGPRHGSVARFSPPRRDLPDPMDLVLWRQAAEAELERALTELDIQVCRAWVRSAGTRL